MGSDENKVVDYGAHNYNVTYNVPLLYSPGKIYQPSKPSTLSRLGSSRNPNGRFFANRITQDVMYNLFDDTKSIEFNSKYFEG